MSTPPLAGLKVLDFTHALAGPYCTMLLASYGAEVCKIEGITTGDMGRTWGPPFLNGEAAYFLGLNPGKEGVGIDIKHPRGHALCLDLAANADILIENLRPGAMERNGLGYSQVSARHPGLIYCSISGYGQNGPSRDEPAMDLILQASSGLISVTGTAGGEPVRSGQSVADVTAGLFALIGILMALRTREQSGRGQWVDVAMFDGMISAMASNYAQYLGTGELPAKLGTAYATIVPYACFPTADRPIAIAVASESLWERFCGGLQRPDWLADPRFASNALRVKHRSAFEASLTELLRTQSSAHWIGVLGAAGVPCSPVRDLAEVAAHPQAIFREMFPAFTHPRAGTVRVTGMPVKLDGVADSRRTAAPRQGEHTRDVLRRWLALGESELDELAAQCVILPLDA